MASVHEIFEQLNLNFQVKKNKNIGHILMNNHVTRYHHSDEETY